MAELQLLTEQERSFEGAGVGRWVPYSAGLLSASNEQAFEGLKSLRLEADAAVHGLQILNLPVVPGAIYDLNFRQRGVVGQTFYWYLIFNLPAGGSFYVNGAFAMTAGWQFNGLIAQAPPNATSMYFFGYNPGGTIGQVSYFDKFSLTTEVADVPGPPPPVETIETISWIDADGVETVLSNQLFTQIPIGSGGRFMPPVELITREVPQEAGSRLQMVRVLAREYEMPLNIKATGPADLRTRVRALVKIFDPTRGDGRIRCTAPDGVQRELTCRYAEGLGMQERYGVRGPTFQKTVIVFKAFDPYWYDVATIARTFQLGGANTVATFFPFFPLRLTSSEIFADITIDNIGDIDAWPVWTFTGPGTALVLRNLTTGKSLSLASPVGAGETINIDTRPGIKSIKSGLGVNLFPTVMGEPSLWPLVRGSNAVRIEVGAATAASAVLLTYRHGHRTP